MNTPKRGEIWRIDFNPTKGSEIQKVRPAVVISSNAIGKLPIKLVVPITDWKDWYENNVWHIKVNPSNFNLLSKTSCIDVLQTRATAIERFQNKIGDLEVDIMEDVITGQMVTVEYNP